MKIHGKIYHEFAILREDLDTLMTIFISPYPTVSCSLFYDSYSVNFIVSMTVRHHCKHCGLHTVLLVVPIVD